MSLTPDDAVELPTETAPADIPVTVAGNFATEDEARGLGHVVASTVRAISRFIDLERLDGITIADDYPTALASIDRGFEASRVLAPTDDGRVLGVAMAVPVMRDGIVKSHVVISSGIVRAFLSGEETAEVRQAIYILAHECGHVEDLKHRDQCFPGRLLHEWLPHFDDALFEQVASAIWEEYAACRASALLATDGETARYAETLLDVLPGARQRSNAAIRAYRIHGDLNRVITEAGGEICQPLKLFAYLRGNLDGTRTELDHCPAELREAIAASPYAEPFVTATAAFRALWDRRAYWESLAEFDPLHQIARDVLADGGLRFRRLPDGQVWVDVPFTPDTG